MRILAFFCGILLAGISAALAGPNIYPDPSFESSGTPGVARTGEKAAVLKVEALNHWNAFGIAGGAVPVEPFARYRVTEYFKGRVGRGNFYAPYCYSWDSYEWAFVAAQNVGTTEDWIKTEVTFVTPADVMYIHPLAYIDAENCEGFADDIVVEKIAEPEEVMAEIATKPQRSDDETRLLVRWLVRQGKAGEARRLMEQTGGELRADLATVLARAAKELAERRAYVVQLVAYGGPTYHRGMEVFEELTADMARERMKIALEAVRLNPQEPRAGRAARMILSAGSADPLILVSDGLARLHEAKQTLEATLQSLPAQAPARAELQQAAEELQAQAAALQARQRELGRCVIRLAGQRLDPQSTPIVLPEAPTPQERYAARDLRYHLELITGQAFPIVSEQEAARGLFVGKTRKALAAGIRFETLGLEGLHIKSVGPSLVLAGNQRGVLYAVYEFLENYLGCRWFAPDCATWPKTGELKIGALNRRYIPPLEFRMGDYPVAKNGAFAVRLRLNGDNHRLSLEQGGYKGVHSLAHTFAPLVPPEKYYATHPEYFSLVGGKRHSGYAQLCLSNPDVLKLCIEGVRRWIKENPDKKVFSVSQNDTANYCECPECTKIAEEEGSQSGPVLRFVNAIADAIAQEHPDVAIETLAYQYTRKPPRLTKPRPNVIICLCSIECCFIHPLETDPFNKSFVEDIRGWSRICNRLWIWDYVINYAHSVCPFPNLYVLKPNINFFLRNGVKGIYEESCYWTRGSELQELRNYILAKTLWDPTYDTQKAINEFCAAYYGPAAPQIIAYIKLIHESVQRVPNLHVQIYTHPKQYVFPDVIVKANALFDQAEAAVANDPVRLHRVRVARLPIMYAQIVLNTSGTFVEREGRLVQAQGQDVGSLLDRFGEIARKEGITAVREGGPDASLEAWLASVPRQPRELEIVTLENKLLRAELLPGLGGRIWRLTYLPTQQPVLRVVGTPQGFSPAEGGYEEYTEGGYRTAGWSERYLVSEKSAHAVTLKAVLRNGLGITRRYELTPDAAVLTIETTATNAGNRPVTAALRSHPEFAVSTPEKCVVRVQRSDGQWQTISLAYRADPRAEREFWLREKDLPAGEWQLVDAGTGLTIADRFTPAEIAQALINRSGQQSRVNLELFGREVTLQPGQSVSLRHILEIRK